MRFSVGAGPVRVGTNISGRGCAPVFGVLVLVGLLFKYWPVTLSALMLYIAFRLWRRSTERQRSRAAQAALRDEQLEEYRAVLIVVDSARQDLNKKLLTTYPLPADVQGKAGERLVISFDHALLTEPRVRHRGMTAGQTATAIGTVLLTTMRVLFLGSTRNCEWLLSKVTRVEAQDHRLVLIAVSNRQTIRGIEFDSPEERVAFQYLLAASSDRAGAGAAARVLDDAEAQYSELLNERSETS